jgi:uncharacterized phage protein (TIGR01671 family)
MKREIKFRAWHEENKDFIYADIQDILLNGYRVAQGTKDISLPYLKKEEMLEMKDWFLVNAEWEQFTGLKDKNGKEIYEGDILKTVNGDNGYISFEDGCFGIVYLEDTECFGAVSIYGAKWYEKSEIIGNIHTTPELLQ